MTTPELYACVYAREFPAQALLRLRPELRNKPCAILEGEPPLQTVCAMNAKARSLGVQYGMTKVELETIPAIVALRRSQIEEGATRNAMLERAAAFTPRIEDRTRDESFCCILDVAGTERLLGPPAILSLSLQTSLKGIGIIGSIAISSNFYTALCLARSLASGVRVVDARQEAIALASLPLSVLDMTSDQAETFSIWGIRTLGMLAALPEKELVSRMGQEAKRYRQMARGEFPHLFVPIETPFTLEERMELDTPVEILESLLFVVGIMLEHLICRAASRVVALAAVTITLVLEGSAEHTRTVRPALPTNDRSLWIKLLHLDLEAHPPQAAILSLTLNADPGSTSKVQLGLFSPQLPEPMRLDLTLARIRVIVGEDNVGSAVLRDTYRPDAHGIKPFMVTSSAAVTETHGTTRAAVRQLRPAESSTVTLQQGRPGAFTFRERRYRVERAYGPWLAAGDWWNATLWNIEQWDLIARAQDGALLCCCLMRETAFNHWQVTALYD